MQQVVVKKFYRDFTSEEKLFLEDIINDIGEKEVEVPGYVVERMIERRIVPHGLPIYDDDGFVDETKVYFLNTIPQYLEVIKTLFEGEPYEVSNEGMGKSSNPFRMVVSREAEDGTTYFVKIAPTLESEEYVKVLDVWKRKGKKPLYPPSHALNQFVYDWDIVDAVSSFFEEKQEMEDPIKRRTVKELFANRSDSDKNANKIDA